MSPRPDHGPASPPSGKFGANAAWYRVTLLTYTVLTGLRRQALPERFHQARPKSVDQLHEVTAVKFLRGRAVATDAGWSPWGRWETTITAEAEASNS